MDVQVLKDARHFAELAASWLATEPFSANVIGVHLGGILGGDRIAGEDDIWIAVIDDGRVVGTAMHTPPHSLFLPRLPAGVAAALAVELSRAGRRVPGVNGEKEAVAEFVDAWAERTGAVSSLRRAMRMYRLEELRPPADTPGAARVAGGADRDLLRAWLEQFQSEAAPGEPLDVEVLMERRLGARELWLWCAGVAPVALAAHSAPAAGVARVGPVYTPPAHRRHGYGSAVTARATDAALAAGAAHVVLYTDLANPTSNAIYQRLGYVADHDAEERSPSDERGALEQYFDLP